MSLKKHAQKVLSQAGITLNGPHPYDPQVHDERIYLDVLLHGRLGLGDGYMHGKWSCENLDEFVCRAHTGRICNSMGIFPTLLQRLQEKIFNLQSIKRAFQVGEEHYDLGNPLYEQMLGESMAYSSAYYGNGANDLTQAQHDKFDLICKKLGFKKGMKVLEIGCGWGTFAQYAIEHYGVEVIGLTVSKEQAAYATERCEGLAFTPIIQDYRTLPDSYNKYFDRVVSIEMIEAVGPKNFRSYMSVAHRSLKDDGLFLMQAIIGKGTPDAWISKRIFPNGTLPTLLQLVTASKDLFSIKDLDSWGQDYDRTLMEWYRRFEERWATISKLKDASGKPLYDDTFRRMWHYYLLACAGTFRAGAIDLSHIVLKKKNIR